MVHKMKSTIEMFTVVCQKLINTWKTPNAILFLNNVKQRALKNKNVPFVDELLDEIEFLRKIYINDKSNVEAYPHIISTLTFLWGSVEIIDYLDNLMNFSPTLKRPHRRGFDFDTLEEIQFLYNLFIDNEKELSIDTQISTTSLNRNQIWNYIQSQF